MKNLPDSPLSCLAKIIILGGLSFSYMEVECGILRRLSFSYTEIECGASGARQADRYKRDLSPTLLIKIQPCEMSKASYVGQRMSYDGDLCTTRYLGELKDRSGAWIGIEWDDPRRGKHNGTHGGKKYFEC